MFNTSIHCTRADSHGDSMGLYNRVPDRELLSLPIIVHLSFNREVLGLIPDRGRDFHLALVCFGNVYILVCDSILWYRYQKLTFWPTCTMSHCDSMVHIITVNLLHCLFFFFFDTQYYVFHSLWCMNLNGAYPNILKQFKQAFSTKAKFN